MGTLSDLPLCVILPPGLQALLMYTGLVRHLAEETSVLLCTSHAHMSTVRRVFGDLDIRYWFDKEHPAAAARALGMVVSVIPESPVRAYASVGLLPIDMHRLFVAERSADREDAVLRGVMDSVGQTFVLTHGDVSPAFLPAGIPHVDVSTVTIKEPMDLCALLNRAAQVHAGDGWVLTLADLVGGATRKFCHAYASTTSVDSCRGKYRKRVKIVPLRA